MIVLYFDCIVWVCDVYCLCSSCVYVCVPVVQVVPVDMPIVVVCLGVCLCVIFEFSLCV